MDRSRFQKQMVQAAESANVDWVRLYDLRRAYGRWHEMAGTPESRIRTYLGHSTMSVTDS